MAGVPMPRWQWTMPRADLYVRAMEDASVVMVGHLREELVSELRSRYSAPELAELDPDAAARAVVAVTSGVWGVRAEHLDRLPGLRAIVSFGVGYDSTDVAEARRRGVVVSNTPDVLTDSVADTAVGLVIDVMRRLSYADRFVRRGEWAHGRVPALARQVSGASVGVLGLGRIGLAIARRLEAFDCTIRYHNRHRRDDVDFAYAAGPIELARSSDVLVVAAAGGAGSVRLVDTAVLDALGPTGFLVNVARGTVVDEQALVTALEQGRIAGAGLDVYEQEPHVPQALMGRDDVVLLPHLGSATVETRAAMTELVLANVAQFLAEGTLLTPVDE
jgi:lactate dehydrogenase-like 2-hydroxyacid dehydrogenase